MADDISRIEGAAAGKRARLRENLLLFAGVPLGWGIIILGFVWVVTVSEPFSIPSGSMMPTLMPGDLVMARENYYQSVEPARGDLVIHRLPNTVFGRGTVFVARVIGLPGDRIQIVGGVLHVNDTPVERAPDGTYFLTGPGGSARKVPRYIETLPTGRGYRLIEENGDTSPMDDTQVYEVPPAHYFTLGDNRDNARDSRYHGSIPAEFILHRPLFVYWSKDRGRIGIRLH